MNSYSRIRAAVPGAVKFFDSDWHKPSTPPASAIFASTIYATRARPISLHKNARYWKSPTCSGTRRSQWSNATHIWLSNTKPASLSKWSRRRACKTVAGKPRKPRRRAILPTYATGAEERAAATASGERYVVEVGGERGADGLLLGHSMHFVIRDTVEDATVEHCRSGKTEAHERAAQWNRAGGRPVGPTTSHGPSYNARSPRARQRGGPSGLQAILRPASSCAVA